MDRRDGDAWHRFSILIHNAALNRSEGRGTWTGVGGLTQMSLSDEAYGPMY